MEPSPACAAGPGALYKPYVGPDMLAWWAREKVKFCQIVHEIIEANFREATMSDLGGEGLAIPKPR